jgi:hypothetical protein
MHRGGWRRIEKGIDMANGSIGRGPLLEIERWADMARIMTWITSGYRRGAH